MELPQKYQEKMRKLLGEEYDAYLACFNAPFHRSLRVNTTKISVQDFLERFPYHLEPVPWNSSCFYFEDPGVTTHPYWFAGLYYIQEASASLPAEVLPISAGDRVLDLCAAPGGKSTHLSAKLAGTGVLVSNDYSVSRSQILLRNLERAGAKNGIVVSESPEKLAEYFPEYFDKILVDAPCSGEGMFRKEPHLIESWMEKDSSYYAPLQKQIAENALKMLKPGGQLVYSTCTFSKEEDEEVIQYLLQLDPSLKVLTIEMQNGFVQNEYGTKLFPHRIKGEGHFVSLLQKGELQEHTYTPKSETFRFETMHVICDHAVKTTMKDRVYMVPETDVTMKGLRILRSGLYLGDEKKNRFEPSECFAMAMHSTDSTNIVSFAVDDARVMKYLKGETLDIKDKKCSDGWVLVCVEEFPLGFAKASKGSLKNKYPKDWIYQGK